MPLKEYEYMYGDEGDTKREILADFDASTDGDYLVQGWIYRLGFEDVRSFETPELATAYAMLKSIQKERRYRVLGPEEAWEERFE